jgi:hypothetical protein
MSLILKMQPQRVIVEELIHLRDMANLQGTMHDMMTTEVKTDVEVAVAHTSDTDPTNVTIQGLLPLIGITDL